NSGKFPEHSGVLTSQTLPVTSQTDVYAGERAGGQFQAARQRVAANRSDIAVYKVVGRMIGGILVELDLLDVVSPHGVEVQWFQRSSNKPDSGKKLSK